MEESLTLLNTDYFDLYQLHGIVDIEAAFALGGAWEPIDDPDLAWLAMHFTLNQDVVAMLPRGLDLLSGSELSNLKRSAACLNPIFRKLNTSSLYGK